MVLARAWRRRLYASLGLAVIVPAALLGSLGLLAVNGGLPSLSVLRQALSGPSTPAAAAPALGGGGQGATAATTAILATTSHPHGTTRASHLGHATTSIPAAPAAGSGVRFVRPSPTIPIQPSGSTHVPGGSGHGGQSTGSGLTGTTSPPRHSNPTHHSTNPPPAHHSQPTAVDRVVNKVTPVTSKLPSPAGSLVTKVVKSVGGLANRLLKPKR